VTASPTSNFFISDVVCGHRIRNTRLRRYH